MRQYYFHDGQVEKGPYLLQELKNESLTHATPVWHEGLAEWTTAGQIAEINALLSTPPPFQNNRASTPPPFATQAAPTYEFPESKKRSYKLPIIIASVLVIGIVGWLVYNNQSQASQLEQIQTEKVEQEIKRKEVNEALTRKNMQYRNNWESYITVGDVHYMYRPVGGIDPFTVPVINNTDYTLEEVQVTVSYIKANGGIHKGTQVTVYNVPPRGQKTVQAPGSSRGTSVRTKITGIYSKKMNFCYPKNNGNPKDPYFCK